MKSVLITNERKIDFSKPQLLTNVVDGAVVMSTGEHNAERFNGAAVNGSNYPLGYYSEWTKKKNFKLFEGKVELSND